MLLVSSNLVEDESLRRLSEIEIKVTLPDVALPTLTEIVEETPVQKSFTPEVPKSEPTIDTQNSENINESDDLTVKMDEPTDDKGAETEEPSEINKDDSQQIIEPSDAKQDEKEPSESTEPIINTSALSFDEKDESIPMINHSDRDD